MPIEILTTASDDGHVLADIFFAAFNTDFDRRILPPTPDVRDWLAAKFNRVSKGQYVNPAGPVLIKAVDTTTGDVVGFAQWKLPSTEFPPSGENVEKQKKVEWPTSGDNALCAKHFKAIDKKEHEFMGSIPHYSLDMLATHPKFGGRGIGSQLLGWGLEEADVERTPTFLTATVAGKPLYEKKGFQVVGSNEITEGFVQIYMVRPADA
ncbi:acyl-CoA N-acyltransferase [Aspergillus pseudotamarii]|uniref:Acyl-CoA N-acyltransferase n=1 Tax=Aspergillus pseudotamarii TaxID=132259 RepID=A0A5N6SJ22_ASPPS|nr:acyl-CoA N-acyltransferase [Aspergillus pseudotamarii]KAE8133671.1 acyl-CoA N-acyltransferase [Aspergillus pseudotamarii]